MSKLRLEGSTSGTGVITLIAPNTNTDRTITLPDVDGTLQTSGVPSGVISMWSGLTASIPTGWNLCDGTLGTPNLVGRFIKGASTAGGTGGSTSTGAHTLSISEMPSHTHNEKAVGGPATTQVANETGYLTLPSTFRQTGAAGGGGSHSHTIDPLYFELCYIMKA
tara:strand:+ start:783 stop:1277 length:495 start_codon:yes stop_codon:yes gene_type:complete